MLLHPSVSLSPDQVHAFVLVGGASRRMGQDKALLELDGMPAAGWIASQLAPHVGGVWIVAKRGQGFEDLGLPVLHDVSEERALVHGIRAALEAAGPPWRFLVACDMPGVSYGETLAALWQAARTAGTHGSFPRRLDRAGLEPLPSLWHSEVARAIRPDWGLEAQGWLRAAGLAEWHVPAAEDAQLENLNTPEDWQAFRSRRTAGRIR